MSRTKKHSCGCAICKPWKHKLEKKYKPSERRKIQKGKVRDTIEHN